MILQGVKLTIQPLGVGYANRPKKAQKGGYVAFSPIYACLALLRGDSAAWCVTIRPGLDVAVMSLPIAWSLLNENF